MPDSSRGSIDLVEVVKRYGSATAVDSLSLRVEPGEFLSLLGPSGCGKTTTLRLIGGFEQPDGGEIKISGEPVAGKAPNSRDVNTVFQSYALFPHMTVAENVAYGLRQHRVKRAEIKTRVGDALEMVKMTAYAKRSPTKLSGGQQQRVALARALVNRPSVLLLDEPLAALDRKLRQEMQVELKLLQRELNMTFVFVTHDQEEALSMSDRIAVMLDGNIVQIGDADQIYDAPTNAFVAGFIGQQNFFGGTLAEGGRSVVVDGVHFESTRGVEVGAGDVVAAIRPEAMRISIGAANGTPHSLAGEVAGVSHLGDVIQYVVRTGRHGELLARVPRAGAPRIDPGADVVCSWEPGDVRIFDDTDRLVAAAREAS